jgi:hypothetical protein
VAIYTLTSARQAPAPSNWTLEVSDDGKHWEVLDTRKNERFPWAQQTRAFGIRQPGSHAYYRVRFDNETATALAEIALLGR